MQIAPEQVWTWFQDTLSPSFEQYQQHIESQARNESAGGDGNAADLLKRVLRDSPDRINQQQQQQSANTTQDTSGNDGEQNPLQPSRDIKNRIVNQYALVTVAEDERTHRPHLPKTEKKPLTRYLNDRVVSTRGDRFVVEKKADTEESKAEEERLKATFVSIRPLRKYRFH